MRIFEKGQRPTFRGLNLINDCEVIENNDNSRAESSCLNTHANAEIATDALKVARMLYQALTS